MKKIYISFLLFFLFFNSSFSQSDSLNMMMVDNRDGKVYKTVKIGTQVWMAENLSFKADSGCWVYKNKQEYLEKYGRLYSFEVAKNICPLGWRLPTKKEFNQLEIDVGSTKRFTRMVCWRGCHGHVLKEGGTSGFNVVLSGVLNGKDNKFRAIKKSGCFWTATEYDNDNVWIMCFKRNDNVGNFWGNKNWGNSVRCLKNN